jgi:hypothetical protein
MLISVSRMFDKPAVWCQCAAVLTATLALSSVLSIQTLTQKQDILWSVVLFTTALLQILVAEHGYRPKLVCSVWQCWSGVLVMLVVAGDSSLLCAVGAVGAVVVPRYYVAVLAVGLLRYPDTLSVLILFKLLAEYVYFEQSNKAVGKTHVYLKQAVAARAVGIVAESILLWYVRCFYRFPHVFRWTPVLTGMVAITVAVWWCQCFVADTTVSPKSIVKAVGHGLTPSLNAAKNCPVCSACLTRLDIEDVFD